MQPRYVLLIAGTLGALAATAQQPTAPRAPPKDDAILTFTVASVKPQLRLQGGGREGGAKPLNEPGRLRFPASTLKRLFMFAYDMKDFQIVGPGWIGDERFAIDATMPPDTTEDQARAMLRNLLADRFKVQIHRETRSLPTYSLVIAKKGLKTTNAPLDAKERRDSAAATDGFPSVPPEFTGVMTFVVNGQVNITAQQATMRELAAQLERLLGVPVMDETKLTAKFNFILRFSSEGLTGPGGLRVPSVPSDAPAGPEVREPLRDIFSALQSEIGLKLEQKRGPVGVIFIDHAEKVPTEN